MGEGMFYVLKPNANPNSIIFVPAFNEKLVGRMQHILSRAEIDALILDAAQGADALWSSDRKERTDAIFREAYKRQEELCRQRTVN